MSLSFDDIKKAAVGDWRIKRHYQSGYFVERRGRFSRIIWWRERKIGTGSLAIFGTVEDARAYIDAKIQVDFVRRTKRGESKDLIYYP